MEQNHLYDITVVCNMLGTTSRTLRFYEEKGLISSTTVGVSSRRQYTEDQLLHIKNVFVLRKLGLSIKSIMEVQQDGSLKDAVLARRTKIYASIDNHMREINLLNEALFALESGKNIFIEDWQHTPESLGKEYEIVKLCTNAILNENDDILYKHLSPQMVQYMPKDVYHAVRRDVFALLGNFVMIDKMEADTQYSNKIYSYIKFSEFGLKITFVFYNEKIYGLWLNYYDIKAR